MRPKWLVCILLAAATFAVYFPVRGHDFIYFDDPIYVTENARVNGGLSWASIIWAFSNPVVANWHPITVLSHMLDCQLFGLNAGPQHLVSAAIHATNGVLLFLVLLRLTGAFWRGAAVAAIFALHPLRVESVAWIAERKDVLSGFFFMLTLWAYAGYAAKRREANPEQPMPRKDAKDTKTEAAGPEGETCRIGSIGSGGTVPGTWDFRFTILFYAMGLMSKPMLVTVPIVLLLLDFWPLRRFERGLEAGPDRSSRGDEAQICSSRSLPKDRDLSLVTSAATLRKWISQRVLRVGADLLIEKWPFFLLTILFSIVTFWVQRGSGAVNSLNLISMVDRIANAIESYGRYLFLFFWPRNLAVIYPHPAAHYAGAPPWPDWDVPVVGILLFALCCVAIWKARKRPWLVLGSFWYFITLVPVIGLVQVGEQAMADRYTYIPMIGPALVLVWQVSEFWLSRGLPKPLLAGGSAVVIGALALATFRQVSFWENTITLFEHTVQVAEFNPSAEFSWGVGLDRAGRMEEAIPHYLAALALAPGYAQAHFNLGQIRRKQEKLPEAAAEYLEELKIRPNDLPTQLNLAQVLARLGRTGEAVEHLETALRVDPASPEVLNNLAWSLATTEDIGIRNVSRAVQLAERACELTSQKQTTMLGTLAACYAAAGRFADAVAAAEKACALATASGDSGLLQTNQQLLELYRAGKPYREPVKVQ
jgi:tetratricopeptide (TPR) repeat protein